MRTHTALVAVAVMVLDKLPFDVRKAGGVARTASIKVIQEIMDAVTIPIMAKCRIGHVDEAKVLEATGVDMIDESEVLTPADEERHNAATSSVWCVDSSTVADAACVPSSSRNGLQPRSRASVPAR